MALAHISRFPDAYNSILFWSFPATMRTRIFSLCAMVAGICAASLSARRWRNLSAPAMERGATYMADKATCCLQIWHVVGSVSILEVRPDVYMLTVDGNNLRVHRPWARLSSIAVRVIEDVVKAVGSIARRPSATSF
jgi:hypothetical protein